MDFNEVERQTHGIDIEIYLNYIYIYIRAGVFCALIVQYYSWPRFVQSESGRLYTHSVIGSKFPLSLTHINNNLAVGLYVCAVLAPLAQSVIHSSDMSVDSVFRTRSLGVAAVGLPDQYADGKAAKVWQLYIGDTKSRTEEYRSWVVSLLKEHGVQRVLDVACGTG